MIAIVMSSYAVFFLSCHHSFAVTTFIQPFYPFFFSWSFILPIFFANFTSYSCKPDHLSFINTSFLSFYYFPYFFANFILKLSLIWILSFRMPFYYHFSARTVLFLSYFIFFPLSKNFLCLFDRIILFFVTSLSSVRVKTFVFQKDLYFVFFFIKFWQRPVIIATIF